VRRVLLEHLPSMMKRLLHSLFRIYMKREKERNEDAN
jgi:hypothetical protein